MYRLLDTTSININIGRHDGSTVGGVIQEDVAGGGITITVQSFGQDQD